MTSNDRVHITDVGQSTWYYGPLFLEATMIRGTGYSFMPEAGRHAETSSSSSGVRPIPPPFPPPNAQQPISWKAPPPQWNAVNPSSSSAAWLNQPQNVD